MLCLNDQNSRGPGEIIKEKLVIKLKLSHG